MSAEKVPVLAFCVNNFSKIESDDAKLKLINLLIQNVSLFDKLGLKIFHELVMQFRSYSFMLKLRVIINLSSGLFLLDY